MNQELRRCVVVSGAGTVGSVFVSLLISSGTEVCVVDIKQPAIAVQFERSDITDLPPNVRTAIKMADLVLLALPVPRTRFQRTRVASPFLWLSPAYLPDFTRTSF